MEEEEELHRVHSGMRTVLHDGVACVAGGPTGFEKSVYRQLVHTKTGNSRKCATHFLATIIGH